MLSFDVQKRGMMPKVAKRVLNDIHRRAALGMGKVWHQEFRDEHFKNSATNRYGYAPRSGERGRLGRNFKGTYTGRKLKEFDHTRPLVYSGTSMARVQAAVSRVSATAKRGVARVRIPVDAPAFNFKRDDSPVDMRHDMTAVIPEEMEFIAGETGKYLAQEYKNVNVVSHSKH